MKSKRPKPKPKAEPKSELKAVEPDQVQSPAEAAAEDARPVDADFAQSEPLRVKIGRADVDLYAQVGPKLYLAKMAVKDLKEQDENARLMEPDMFNQLVANVKRRGALESLPLCAATPKGIEIVSGHHRTRAAVAAGMAQLFVLLDVTGLSRSQVASKQLSHNTIAGYDDMDVMRRIARHITDVDDALAAFLPEAVKLDVKPLDLDKMIAPHVKFDWKNVAIVFLPHQFAEFEEVVNWIQGQQDLVGVAPLDCFRKFSDHLAKFGRFKNVVSVGTVMALLTRMAKQALDEGVSADDLVDEDGDVVRSCNVEIGMVLGRDNMPPRPAATLRKALDRMVQRNECPKDEPWQALEKWATQYLEGIGSSALRKEAAA